jgi:diaminohydroxyphosphoribosylaminopyrimidine deaminase/5-amino-6-(5-phosphoribosylamino)uracil reductase
VVKNGVVIGEGWHQRTGDRHAEVNALADVAARGDDPRGATVYVTLEPCNHVGRTPPCTQAVIAAGVTRVVVAMADPNPAAMQGAQRLRDAGIAVDVGLMDSEARELNIGFVSRVTRGRPWVRIKAAASLDGRTALDERREPMDHRRGGARRWSSLAREGLRGDDRCRHGAAGRPAAQRALGRNTAQPRKIIVDRHGQTPVEAKVLTGDVLIFTAGERNPAWPEDVDVMTLPDEEGTRRSCRQ